MFKSSKNHILNNFIIKKFEHTIDESLYCIVYWFVIFCSFCCNKNVDSLIKKWFKLFVYRFCMANTIWLYDHIS